jgi:hypothetical protein
MGVIQSLRVDSGDNAYMLYLCHFEEEFCTGIFCVASSPCDEFVNECDSVAISKPIHSHVPMAVREFQFLCSNDIYFVTFVSSSYCLLNVIFFSCWLKQW